MLRCQPGDLEHPTVRTSALDTPRRGLERLFSTMWVMMSIAELLHCNVINIVIDIFSFFRAMRKF